MTDYFADPDVCDVCGAETEEFADSWPKVNGQWMCPHCELEAKGQMRLKA